MGGSQGRHMAFLPQWEWNSCFFTNLSHWIPPLRCPLFRPLCVLRLQTIFWPLWISQWINHSKLALISGPLQPVLCLEYSSQDLYHSWLLLVTQVPTHLSGELLQVVFTLESVTLFPFPHIMSHYPKISQLFTLLLICGPVFFHEKVSTMRAGNLADFGHCCISTAQKNYWHMARAPL